MCLKKKIVHQKSWKLAFKTSLSVHNIHLNCVGRSSIENSKWILCSQKKVLNVRIQDLWWTKCIWFSILFWYHFTLLVIHNYKRYFKIDLHLARYFMFYGACLSSPLLFLCSQKYNPFVNSMISTNQEIGLEF